MFAFGRVSDAAWGISSEFLCVSRCPTLYIVLALYPLFLFCMHLQDHLMNTCASLIDASVVSARLCMCFCLSAFWCPFPDRCSHLPSGHLPINILADTMPKCIEHCGASAVHLHQDARWSFLNGKPIICCLDDWSGSSRKSCLVCSFYFSCFKFHHKPIQFF